MAALSNPAIRSDFIENDTDFAFSKQLLISECKKYKIVPEDVAEPVHESNNTQNVSFLFSARRARRSSGSSDSEIYSEVMRFLTDPDTNSKLLNQFPAIREVFLRYNTTLSSSAAVERVFSQSLMIFTPRRNRLSAANFEQTLMLKHNQKLQQKTNT